MLPRVISALCLALLLPLEAQACPARPSYAVIHSALPRPLPEGAFIADIRIESRDPMDLYASGLRARVRRMIAGKKVRRIVLRLPAASSCHAPFANGRSGLIVGIAKGRLGNELVVRPLLVSRNERFRLADGFRLADAYPGTVLQH